MVMVSASVQANAGLYLVVVSHRRGLSIEQWFLTWVRSNPRGSVSQFQGFGGLVHPTRMIRDVTLCLAIIGCS